MFVQKVCIAILNCYLHFYWGIGKFHCYTVLPFIILTYVLFEEVPILTVYHCAKLHIKLMRPFLCHLSLFVPYKFQFISSCPLSISILDKLALKIFLEVCANFFIGFLQCFSLWVSLTMPTRSHISRCYLLSNSVLISIYKTVGQFLS